MIADMKTNIKLCPINTELFLRGRKLNISLAFVSQSCFNVPKTIRLNATHYFVMKIPNKTELQQITSNHSFDIEFKNFIKIYKDFTIRPFSFSVSDTISPSDNPFRFRKNIL